MAYGRRPNSSDKGFAWWNKQVLILGIGLIPASLSALLDPRLIPIVVVVVLILNFVLTGIFKKLWDRLVEKQKTRRAEKENVAQINDPARKYKLQNDEIQATARLNHETTGFTVLKCSKAVLAELSNLSDSASRKRKELIDQGILEKFVTRAGNNQLEFTKDYEFASALEASRVLLGYDIRETNVGELWVKDGNISLGEVLSEIANPSVKVKA